ncbi:MAG: cytochrome c [Acidobacteria bacterium]|nr:cytochrome c [Acidobacteriota bacterium]MBI3658838.1 cytochrome c [Acidobacteriota bacterium]
MIAKLVKITTLLSLGLFVICYGAYVKAGDAGKPGADLHKTHCFKCHGESGKGDGPAAKILKPKPTDWSDAEKMSKVKDEDLMKMIKEGGASVGKSKLMPAFKEKLSDDEIRQTVKFVRSFSSQK